MEPRWPPGEWESSTCLKINEENPIELVRFQLLTELPNSSSHRKQSYKCSIVSVCQLKKNNPKEIRFYLAHSRVANLKIEYLEPQLYILYVNANCCVFIHVLFIHTDY